ncbi:hypothetical protein WECO103172_03725 [Weissella confusa]
MVRPAVPELAIFKPQFGTGKALIYKSGPSYKRNDG